MAQARLRWALLLIAVAGAAPGSAADVIAHPGYPEPHIARPLLRGVFGMRIRAWPDGTPVRVFVLEDSHPVHQEFAKSVLQMYPYQLRQNWDRLLYSGTGQPPIVVASEEELLRRVAETPGGIGYLSEYRPPVPPPPSKSKTPAKPPAAIVKVLHVR